MNNIALMKAMVKKEIDKEMNKLVMDGFNRDSVMFCCDTASITRDSNVGEITTNVKDVKFCNVGTTAIKDRFEDYVRKDELEALIDKVRVSNGYTASCDKVADAFKLVSEKLGKGNKKENEFLIFNFEKEIEGYELLE